MLVTLGKEGSVWSRTCGWFASRSPEVRLGSPRPPFAELAERTIERCDREVDTKGVMICLIPFSVVRARGAATSAAVLCARLPLSSSNVPRTPVRPRGPGESEIDPKLDLSSQADVAKELCAAPHVPSGLVPASPEKLTAGCLFRAGFRWHPAELLPVGGGEAAWMVKAPAGGDRGYRGRVRSCRGQRLVDAVQANFSQVGHRGYARRPWPKGPNSEGDFAPGDTCDPARTAGRLDRMSTRREETES